MTHLTPEQSEGGPDSLSLADFIRNRRAELDVSKSEAARRAGVSRRTWHEVEEGTRVTSTAITLSQFDQALQLPPGTLFRLTSQSLNRRAQSLRQRAHDLVRMMTTDELEYFVSSRGTESVPQLLRHLTEAHEQLVREVAMLRSMGLRVVSEENRDDSRRAITTATEATEVSQELLARQAESGDRTFPSSRSVDRGADRSNTL